MQKVKDVTIGDVEYQIARINPLDGSYIIQLLLRTVLPDFLAGAMSKAAKDEATEIPTGKGRPMTREEMREMQTIALNVCRKYKFVGEQKVAIPITANDEITDDDLQADIGSVLALTAHSLIFSVVSPFFAEDGLKKLLPKEMQGMASAFKPSSILT